MEWQHHVSRPVPLYATASHAMQRAKLSAHADRKLTGPAICTRSNAMPCPAHAFRTDDQDGKLNGEHVTT